MNSLYSLAELDAMNEVYKHDLDEFGIVLGEDIETDLDFLLAHTPTNELISIQNRLADGGINPYIQSSKYH